VLSANDARALVAEDLFPKLRRECRKLDRIDHWYRWDHERPHQPRQSTREYRELAARSETPWGNLVVTSVAQTLFIDGYRRADDAENADAWRYWQANAMDARQTAIFRAALAYGLSYATVLPGKDFMGSAIPVIRGVSPRRMIAVYEDAAQDELPEYALRAEPTRINKNTAGWNLTLIDDDVVWSLVAQGDGESFTAAAVTGEHGLGFCPVVRFANQLDLEGRSPGEVEPYIPVFGRIDQTTFDRLVVQRFASWVVRTIAGMSIAETVSATGETPEAAKMRLRVEDLLVATDKDTKFGSLPASPLDGFIAAGESDLKALSAVSQTPAHEVLGSMANLSAEALAAARASQTAKSDERKTSFGESAELALRIAAVVDGDSTAATDVSAQVRWRDTEIRSLAQAADALGKLATMLGVPVEVLWEKIPGWTQQDVDHAKALVQQEGGMAALLRQLAQSQQPPAPAPAPAPAPVP
jgi:hypothetical protein